MSFWVFYKMQFLAQYWMKRFLFMNRIEIDAVMFTCVCLQLGRIICPFPVNWFWYVAVVFSLESQNQDGCYPEMPKQSFWNTRGFFFIVFVCNFKLYYISICFFLLFYSTSFLLLYSRYLFGRKCTPFTPYWCPTQGPT